MAGRHRTARASNPRRAVTNLLIAVAIAAAWVAVGLTGTGGTFAAWSSSVTLPDATLHTGSAGLRLDGFDQLGATFATGALTAGPDKVTLTNTGTATLRGFTASTALAGTGASTLATALTVTFWPIANGTACGTAPQSAITGKWSSVPNWLANQGPLAPGAVSTYCVTTTSTSAATTSYAGKSVTPTVTVTAATQIGGGWSATAQGAPFTFSTPAPWTKVTNPTQYGISAGNGTAITVTSQSQTIDGDDYLCFDIAASGGYGGRNGSGWQVLINTTKSPFRGVAVGDWVWPAGSAARAGVDVTSSGYGTQLLTDTNSRSNSREFQLCVPTD
ncbi:hypothetical protein GCM10022286_30520 [Gryllotalpicola daejeonensis]|uniref:Ig-like domain-containing protein n=1 Tax=Gryllotalpicola daejeonensis TaxID=993087 RepID=A0ABP7ZNL3_9MICO